MRAYRFWTEEDTATAVAMRAAGQSLAAIADRFGRTPRSVEQFLYRVKGGFNKLKRTCSACQATISDKNKSGTCRRCTLRNQNYDPGFTATRLRAMKSSPKIMAGAPIRKLAARKAAAKRLSDPEYRARLVEFMRTVVQPASHAANAKRDNRARGLAISDARLRWCPESWRDEYRKMRASGIHSAKAKQMVLAMAAAEKARPKTFEEQLRAVAEGRATLCVMPVASNDLDFTAGGVSSGWAA
jgi:hypothetical protein